LLVLRRENPTPDFQFDLFEGLRSISVGLKQFSRRPAINLVVRYRIVLSLGCNSGNDQARPSTIYKGSRKIIGVKPLLRYDHQTFGLIVKTAAGRIAKPIISGLEHNLRIGVVGFGRVIDDKDIASATGQRATYRSRKSGAAFGSLELGFGRLFRIKPCWKDPLIESALHQRPTIAREFMRKLFRIAGAYDPKAWFATQQPRDPGN
jgi:hypothetical protein